MIQVQIPREKKKWEKEKVLISHQHLGAKLEIIELGVFMNLELTSQIMHSCR